MKLQDVTNADGRMCAQLLNLLKAGRWDLSGQDITAHGETVKWVHALAMQMAQHLSPSSNKPQTAPVPSKPAGQMRVKQIGSIAGSSGKKRKK